MSVNIPDYFQAKMGLVMIDGSIVGCAQSYTDNLNRPISEIQCIGSDSVRKTAGSASWDVQFDALQILTQDASSGRKTYEDLMDHHRTSTQPVTVMLMPQTADVSAGQIYYYGSALIESISRNVPVGSEPVSYSVSLQGSGDLSRGVLGS